MLESFQLEMIDYVIFFAALTGVMAIGLFAGRKEDTAEDYFLAGRSLPWYGIAGSIFGSNVSANHLVGMMGIGFSIGFAQSHFELGAVAALLLLCYGFLPVYRKLNLYTLSGYLGKRFDDRSRISYTVIMVFTMVVLQMVPGLYIGSRSICFLLGGDALQLDLATGEGQKVLVSSSYYVAFVIGLGVIAATYTFFGGLKAVVWTDVIQSILMLLSGIGLAIVTFANFGGWEALMNADMEAGALSKMRLYLPVNHPELPWTGALTGLMFMHCFYWGTNQFIVQRALGAKSDKQARIGIIAAGFLKLLIPFFTIATGVAAFYMFQKSPEFQGQKIDPDTAFTVLVNHLIGPGFVGLIAAGLIGAILSSIDSMMNSAATLVTMDIYKPYVKPDATDREMIVTGRMTILVSMVLAVLMAIFVMDPNSEKNFFLQIVDYQTYFTPGLLMAFLLGMFWKRGTSTAAFVTIIAGVVFSWMTVWIYDTYLGSEGALLGEKINFLHRVVVVAGLSSVVFVIVSLMESADPEKSSNTWSGLGGHAPERFKRLGLSVLLAIGIYVLLGMLVYLENLTPAVAAWIAAAWTLGAYLREVVRSRNHEPQSASLLHDVVTDDRTYAGLLAACAMFIMFYFF